MTDHQPLDSAALNLLFFKARTFNHWTSKDVSDALLEKIFGAAIMGPTSANCLPMRAVFVKSKAGKEKLRPCLNEGNVEKTMSAPVTAIFANDRKFYEFLPQLFPHTDAKSWFVGKPDYIEETMRRNGTLQAGYFIMAARAYGLDCGPMSGFDPKKMKDAFFPSFDGEVNFICNLGYGDPAGLHARSPRFAFEEVCKIV